MKKDILKPFESSGWRLFGYFAAAIAIFFSLNLFIDRLITYKLRDPEVIKQIAYLVRPSLIFDQNGNYEIDNGAAQFIKDISIEKDQKGNVKRVTVSPKESLNVHPLLTCLNGTIFFQPTRQKASWVFEVVGGGYIVIESSKPTEKYLFELQIVR